LVAAASDVNPASPKQLARRLSWSLATVSRRLPRVIKSGALVQIASDRYLRPSALQPLGTIYAVELKLNDWRRALTQCRTYRTWADSYVLVMPRLSAEAEEVLRHEIARDRGGLYVGSEWLVYPAKSRLSRARRLWSSEHVVAARRRG
jgi:hypothetical protein